MAKTIIQTIGPLYGEVVNGTVFGRPNGSIFIPSVNTVKMDVPDENKYLVVEGSRVYLSTSTGTRRILNIVAESQDNQSYIATYVTDGDGNEVGGPRNGTAGQFNVGFSWVAQGAGVSVEDQATYTLYAVLMASTGVPVATTSVEVTGVVI